MGIWIWIWIWRLILRLTGRLGWSTMASPTTLHIGRQCHVMHSQDPGRTFPLHPLRSRAGWLSHAAPRAQVGALQMCGRHPPVCCLNGEGGWGGESSGWGTECSAILAICMSAQGVVQGFA